MEARDKLEVVLDKLTDDQVRILTRLAEILVEEQRADPMHDMTDVHTRYDQFKSWCNDSGLDLSGVDAWVTETRQAAARASMPPASAAK